MIKIVLGLIIIVYLASIYFCFKLYKTEGTFKVEEVKTYDDLFVTIIAYIVAFVPLVNTIISGIYFEEHVNETPVDRLLKSKVFWKTTAQDKKEELQRKLAKLQES